MVDRPHSRDLTRGTAAKVNFPPSRFSNQTSVSSCTKMSLSSPSSQAPDVKAQPVIAASVADSSQKITRGHSCVLCQQRKVKCDRQKPCSNCVKARAECVVAAPAQPRRRRKKLTESDLVLRLRRYEHLLKSHGVKVELEDLHPQDYPRTSKNDEDVAVSELGRLTMNAPASHKQEPGSLFFGQSRAHYVEKYALNKYIVIRSNDR